MGVASMMRHLIVLKIPVDTWFVQNADNLKSNEPEMLSTAEWWGIMDVCDVLGLITPITCKLEKAADPGIVYVLPTLLALLTKDLSKTADTAFNFSGRSKAQIAVALLLPESTPSSECISPIQKQIIDELIRAFFGEK
jgi:hypothetical protein